MQEQTCSFNVPIHQECWKGIWRPLASSLGTSVTMLRTATEIVSRVNKQRDNHASSYVMGQKNSESISMGIKTYL